MQIQGENNEAFVPTEDDNEFEFEHKEELHSQRMTSHPR